MDQLDEASAKAHKAGGEMAQRLEKALKLHGLTFPSLWGDWPVAGTPMVHLGSCRGDVAEALAVILEEAASKRVAEDEKTEP